MVIYFYLEYKETGSPSCIRKWRVDILHLLYQSSTKMQNETRIAQRFNKEVMVKIITDFYSWIEIRQTA